MWTDEPPGDPTRTLMQPHEREAAQRIAEEHQRLRSVLAAVEEAVAPARDPVAALVSTLAFDHRWMQRQLVDLLRARGASPTTELDDVLGDSGPEATRPDSVATMLARVEEDERSLQTALQTARREATTAAFDVVMAEQAQHTRAHLRRLKRVRDAQSS